MRPQAIRFGGGARDTKEIHKSPPPDRFLSPKEIFFPKDTFWR